MKTDLITQDEYESIKNLISVAQQWQKSKGYQFYIGLPVDAHKVFVEVLPKLIGDNLETGM